MASLPNIKHKVLFHLEKVRKQLSNLPELPANVELEVETALINFADSARSRMGEFMKRFNVLPRSFRDCLLEIKPKFTLRDKSDFPVLEISDDDSDTTAAASYTTPNSKRLAAIPHSTPTKRLRLDRAMNTGAGASFQVKAEDSSAISIRASAPLSVSSTPTRRPMLPEPFAEFSFIGRGFRTLRQVRDDIEAKTKAGMPDHTSDDVYVDLVLEAIRPWDRPMEVFLGQTMRELQSVLESTLDLALDKLKKRFIHQEAKKHLRQFLDEHRKETEKALRELYEDETQRLFTFNDEAFEQYRDKEQNVLTRFRHNMRMEANGLETKPLGQWSEMTEEKRMQDSKRREAEMLKLGPDKFVREIEVIAYVRGYYRLAALRFADAVSQRIICRTIPAIRRRLQSYLEEKLHLRGATTRSVYERLMAEDEATANKRETLKSEREKFDKALASIEILETTASVGGECRPREEESPASDSLTTMDIDAEMEEV